MAKQPSQGRIASLIATASEGADVSPSDVRNVVHPHREPVRLRRVVRARWAVWKALREEGFGYAPIANAWGCNLNHTSIMYAERQGWGLPEQRQPLTIWGRAA